MQIRKENHLHICTRSMILISPTEAHPTTYDNPNKSHQRSNLSKWCWHGIYRERKVQVKWHHETRVRPIREYSFTRSSVSSQSTSQWKSEIQSPRRLLRWYSSTEEGDLFPSVIVVRTALYSRNWNRPKKRIVISVQRIDDLKKTTCENEKKSILSTIQPRLLLSWLRSDSLLNGHFQDGDLRRTLTGSATDRNNASQIPTAVGSI